MGIWNGLLQERVFLNETEMEVGLVGMKFCTTYCCLPHSDTELRDAALKVAASFIADAPRSTYFCSLPEMQVMGSIRPSHIRAVVDSSKPQ